MAAGDRFRSAGPKEAKSVMIAGQSLIRIWCGRYFLLRFGLLGS